MALLYNFLMLAVDVAALTLAWRRRTVLGWLMAMACAAFMAAALSALALLAEDPFGVLRLAAYGIFGHGVFLLILSPIILWRRSRLLAMACVLAAACVIAIAIDSFLIEPTAMEVTRIRIATSKLSRPQKIVVLADFQADRFTDYERNVLQRTMAEKPDVILLAGDYLQAPPPQRRALCWEVNAYLREIHFGAPGGVYAVQGNVDEDDWKELFDGLGVKMVEITQPFDLDQLRITLLSPGDSYWTYTKIPADPAGRFQIVMGHSPNFSLGQIDADLLVAGHTHGGQVRLPWIGPLITNSLVPRAWAAGMTDLPSGAKLLVSRGVGMERQYAPRMRFLCRPELVVIDLVPEGE